MQDLGESSMRARMVELRRLVCEQEIPVHRRRIDSLHSHYPNIFDNVKAEAQGTIELQNELAKVKGGLREAEDALVKSLAVKTRKEAKKMAVMESISVMKSRVESLKRTVEDQRERKDEYTAILSRHSEALTACKDQCSQSREHQRQIEEAISWYSRVLGFCVECSHGVKFIFKNINPVKPSEEYFFTIRCENDIYTLLNCDPHLSDTKEIVKELNTTNGLFKFVRSMRKKFQEAAAQVLQSVPVALVPTDHTYDSPLEEKGDQLAELNSNSRKVRKGNQTNSPRSSLRRSARLKVISEYS